MTAKPITFTDEQGNEWTLLASRNPSINPSGRKPKDRLMNVHDATPDDLARAGYEPTTQALDRLAIEASIVAEDTRRELEALRAFEQYFRATKHYVRHGGPFPVGNMNELLKAIDEARK